MPATTRRTLILAARAAARQGNHALASQLFGLLGITYVHEVQIWEVH